MSASGQVEVLRRAGASMTSDAVEQLGFSGVIDGLQAVAGPTVPCVGRAHIAYAHRDTKPGIPGLSGYLESAATEAFLVVAFGSNLNHVSSFGGLAARYAVERGLSGLVSSGWVRDVADINSVGLPVWSAGSTPRTGQGRLALDQGHESVTIQGVPIQQADYVVADLTGVCVVPARLVDSAASSLSQRLEAEESFARLIDEGEPFSNAQRRTGAL